MIDGLKEKMASAESYAEIPMILMDVMKEQMGDP